MKKLLYLLSWFVVFVPAVVFADSDIKSGLPPTIPNYNWETSFETINSENNLVLLTTMPKSPYLNIEGSVGVGGFDGSVAVSSLLTSALNVSIDLPCFGNQ